MLINNAIADLVTYAHNLINILAKTDCKVMSEIALRTTTIMSLFKPVLAI